MLLLDKEEKHENNISNTAITNATNAITAGSNNQASDVDSNTKEAHDSGVKMLS